MYICICNILVAEGLFLCINTGLHYINTQVSVVECKINLGNKQILKSNYQLNLIVLQLLLPGHVSAPAQHRAALQLLASSQQPLSCEFIRSIEILGYCYIMPAARAYLQISLGKTRSTPTFMHELMTTHVAVKDHVTP